MIMITEIMKPLCFSL